MKKMMESMRKNKRKVLIVAVLIFLLLIVPLLPGCSKSFGNLNRVQGYLSLARTVGRSERGPLPLRVRGNLGEDGWQRLLGIINNSGVRVNLDLSRSTIIDREFDPGGGSSLIVSLILPNNTTSITGDFSNFTNLTRIRFPASADLGETNPFAGSSTLTSIRLRGRGNLSVIEGRRALVRNGNELVAFPTASGSITLNNITVVGDDAFFGTTGLESINLPAATAIGGRAFAGNTGLENISLPVATVIGDRAFAGNTSLQTANLPRAVAIGERAFLGNTSLETLNIPAVTSIGNNALENTGNTALTITTGASLGSIGQHIFYGVAQRKEVTLRVPYATEDIPATLTFAFRGRGWVRNEETEAFGFVLGINRTVGTGWQARQGQVANANPNVVLTIEGVN